jgi:hypothetical protein
MTKIPDFTTLDEAVDFWETHDSAEYFDEMQEVSFDVELHQPLFYPNVVILTHQPDHCPRCHQSLEPLVIEYVVWNSGHLIVIRDVPVLQCRVNTHTYMLEKTYNHIEHLLELETTQKLQPTETIQTPVFSLRMAV